MFFLTSWCCQRSGRLKLKDPVKRIISISSIDWAKKVQRLTTPLHFFFVTNKKWNRVESHCLKLGYFHRYYFITVNIYLIYFYFNNQIQVKLFLDINGTIRFCIVYIYFGCNVTQRNGWDSQNWIRGLSMMPSHTSGIHIPKYNQWNVLYNGNMIKCYYWTKIPVKYKIIGYIF